MLLLFSARPGLWGGHLARVALPGNRRTRNVQPCLGEARRAKTDDEGKEI